MLLGSTHRVRDQNFSGVSEQFLNPVKFSIFREQVRTVAAFPSESGCHKKVKVAWDTQLCTWPNWATWK